MVGIAYAGAALALLLTASCGGQDPTVHPLERTVPATSGGQSQSPPPPPGSPDALLVISDPRVAESSGLARSPGHDGVLYTHNDKGSGPELFAIDASGTRAVLSLEGAASVDWEDVASTPDGRLWVGDIGDNEGRRSEISVYVVEEPTELRSSTLPVTRYRFRYADGPRNAEALLVHPETSRVYVVSKEPGGGTVYVAPRKLRQDRLHTLRPLRDAPPAVTGGDFAPDGTSLVLRNYGRVFFYPDLSAEPVLEGLPKQPQGESIAFDEDGTHVLVGSEGRHSEVLRVAVPEASEQ